ncbi:MAG: hypothetical protein EXS10_00580 [Phycisphaerales bacterium]|nr:hypothetical protein [Phycisphaerales bacterium]
MLFIALPLLASSAFGQIAVDGSADKGYGAALAVQNTQTQFGDSNLGLIGFANGSEIDGCFAKIDGGKLYLMFTGNLETNWNKLDIFIDATPGGQNRVLGNNASVDFNALNRMGDDLTGNGLTFDAAFAADFWVSFTGGDVGAGVYNCYMNFATMPTKGAGAGSYAGPGGAGAKGAIVTKAGFSAAINNSNILGVIGGTDVGDGAGVSTGVEIAIPLAQIPGYIDGDIKICAFVNGGGHNYLSNQVMGGLGGGANLGEPRAVNFDFIPGNQFVTVANGGGGGNPCPADLNGDTFVDAADLASLLNAWDSNGAAGGDLNGDGIVDAADLAMLLNAWGACV